MKNTLYLFLLLTISSVYAQESKWVKIEYTQVLGNQITKSSLEYNNYESIYLLGNFTKIDTTSENMTYIVTDDIGSVIYKNKIKNKLFSRDASKEEVVLINDVYPTFNWKISDATKKVDALILKKATTNFRGRDYIAWFDETMPSSNGPLKMGGLPGTILELSTVDGFLNISFDKIYTNENKSENLDRILNKFDRVTTQKEWVAEVKEKIKNYIATMKARQGRDEIMNITFDDPLERKYEWEETK
jgi:GLPGLI family protein